MNMFGCMRMSEFWMDGWMDGWMGVCVGRWLYVRVGECMDTVAFACLSVCEYSDRCEFWGVLCGWVLAGLHY